MTLFGNGRKKWNILVPSLKGLYAGIERWWHQKEHIKKPINTLFTPPPQIYFPSIYRPQPVEYHKICEYQRISQQYLWRHKQCWILIKLELYYQFISYFISYFLNNFLISDYSAIFYEANQYKGKLLFFLHFRKY